MVVHRRASGKDQFASRDVLAAFPKSIVAPLPSIAASIAP
jgi:hypothetical protein